jgi:hypothetical protein
LCVNKSLRMGNTRMSHLIPTKNDLKFRFQVRLRHKKGPRKLVKTAFERNT